MEDRTQYEADMQYFSLRKLIRTSGRGRVVAAILLKSGAPRVK